MGQWQRCTGPLLYELVCVQTVVYFYSKITMNEVQSTNWYHLLPIAPYTILNPLEMYNYNVR